MAILVAQVVAPLILLFGTFFLGTLPIFLVRKLYIPAIGPRILSFLVCFGGGVIFCVTFLHIVPDVIEGFSDVHTSFPLPEAVVCIGFLAIYAIEELIHLCVDHGHSAGNHQPADDRDPSAPYFGDSLAISFSESQPISPSPAQLNREVTISGLLIIAALSFHSLFEGLALGLQQSEKDTWLLFMGVSIHKLVLAFVVGFDLSAAGISAKVLMAYMAVFAIMSPAGALIGAGFLTSKKFNGVPVASMNGLAAGTLLYVTFFEVLQRKQNANLPRMWRVFAVSVGFAFMTMLIALLPDRD
ncbi:zinc transporter ZIP1-like [Ornithodoros turicata]|uniref:zinc transporter ZIP1-like n=1 Tax=Ornithodoros turicata TaxID=34597 RepID=UPI00313A4C94